MCTIEREVTTDKKIIQHGNSLAPVINKPILELFKINIDTSFEILANGKSVIILQQTETDKNTDILGSLEEIHNKLGNALRH